MKGEGGERLRGTGGPPFKEMGRAAARPTILLDAAG